MYIRIYFLYTYLYVCIEIFIIDKILLYNECKHIVEYEQYFKKVYVVTNSYSTLIETFGDQCVTMEC